MAIDKGTDLAVVDEMPAVISDNLVAIAEAAEKRVQAINRIKRAALAVTNARDWTDQNGQPYLQASGAEKIARLFGISWRIDEPVFSREEDGHFSYTYKGYFTLGSATIEAIGARGSRDPFFSRKHGQDVPPGEIDKNDVKKAAYTNCIGNGVTRILGIRNLSWEDLQAANIEAGKVARVEYQQREMSTEAVDQRKAIGAMLMEMAGGNTEGAADLLENHTYFVNKEGKTVKGKRTLAELSEKQIPITYRKVKETYEKWKAQKGTTEEAKTGGSGNGASGQLFDEQPA